MADTIVFDGFTGLEKGMNNGIDQDAIPRNQVADALNARFRGLFAECRPGFNQQILTFVDGCGDAFKAGLFQGSGTYYPIDGKEPVILASVSGHIYLAQMAANNEIEWQISDITIVDSSSNSGYDENVPTLDLAWFCQADSYMVIQNGRDIPLIFDGSTLRRSDIANGEIPVGRQMAYGQGRIFLVSSNGNEVVAGDIAGGGTSVVSFSEYRLKLDGFAINPQYGKITGLQFMAQTDTSLGQGALLVSTETSISTLNVTTARDSWTTTPNFQTISLLSNGFVGSNAFTTVNSDVWYRSRDGIRSFVVARRSFGQWSNTPKSREIQETIRYDTQSLLKYTSAVYFDNRLIMTSRPNQDDGRWWNESMTVLDFNPLASVQQADAPAYDGVWTGFRPTKLFTLITSQGERCLSFSVSEEGENQLWEISRDDDFDNGNCRIPWSITPGGYDWNAKGQRKRIRSAEYWIDKLRGQADFTFYFRPDEYPFWQPWSTDSETADQSCEPSVNGCGVPVSIPYQYRARLTLPEPVMSENTLTDGQMSEGFNHQIRIDIVGRCRFKGMRIGAYVLPNEAAI